MKNPIEDQSNPKLTQVRVKVKTVSPVSGPQLSEIALVTDVLDVDQLPIDWDFSNRQVTLKTTNTGPSWQLPLSNPNLYHRQIRMTGGPNVKHSVMFVYEFNEEDAPAGPLPPFETPAAVIDVSVIGVNEGHYFSIGGHKINPDSTNRGYGYRYTESPGY